jgi:hypothetical protein
MNYLFYSNPICIADNFLVKVVTEYTELSPVNAGVAQGSVLGLLLYLICTPEI